MVRGHEEASTSQAGRKIGTHGKRPRRGILVATMSVEDLRSFRQVPAAIRLEVLDDTATSTIRAAANAIYFTREQFAAGLYPPSLPW